ncbi:Pimeloyl-ACP methyl ester carboxylesterase [Marivirga sericea]|uniref:Pimeloyl-ACP methyl ester carboxylesterase n=1 Tax=Marivirga sericea TaxID=1028 RepID=A0A1X7IFX4_9BACT|nr:alpha/beta fold hydrolase [Marivirga sericea]SMG13633.1 Pimeloyl-ACP methyl ester carboxylesterase [Marivirga sericea]
MKARTQYTKSGRINIAYQVFGSGLIDLVYIPGWVSNIDMMWACPELVHFLEELGKVARVILFDKRGTGLSDRIVELSTLEERMDDIRAVMDAVGSEKAALFGHSEGGSVSALFAATYPNRTVSLMTFGVFAKRRYSDDYPWAPTDYERQEVFDMIETSWGSGDMNLQTLAPSKANDPVFMDWLANYFRSGASPSAAMVLTKMNTEVDIINILNTIKVPTLLMQRTEDIDVKIEEGRFIAERIEGAKFVEFEGEDHLFWAGNTKEILAEMKAFMLQVEPQRDYEKQLYTIVSARILSQQAPNSKCKEQVKDLVLQYRGKIIEHKEGTLIAIFEGPSKAVHCCMDISATMQKCDTELSLGVHIRESTIAEIGFISEETDRFIESILNLGLPNQILLTQTVKYLLSGAGINFSQYKSVVDQETGASHLLYIVSDQTVHDDNPTQIDYRNKLPQSHSFLENVLQIIEKNMSVEEFGVDMLCKEVGVSERQLQRKLKAITNKSPNQLISSVRLHKAKELLISHGENVSEVAYLMGYTSPSYFSKRFKREFGISPSVLQ